jgi:hypothetical protein
MLKSKLMAGSTLIASGLLFSQAVWAIDNDVTRLPGPAVVGLVAAAVIGAIALSRSKK